MKALGEVLGILIFAIAVGVWAVWRTPDQAALTAATLALATATYLLFKKTAESAQRTADLANDTVQANRPADLHHQEALMPYVVAEGRFYATGRQGTAVPGGDFHRITFQFGGKLTNLGGGPALNVRAWLTADLSWVHQDPKPLETLATNERREEHVYLDPVDARQTARRDGNVVPGKLRIEYDSIFGSGGVTEIVSPSGRFDDAHITVRPPKPISRDIALLLS